MGVTVCDPETMELPACATDLGNGTWVRYVACVFSNCKDHLFQLVVCISLLL